MEKNLGRNLKYGASRLRRVSGLAAPVMALTAIIIAVAFAGLAAEPQAASAHTKIELLCNENPTTRSEGQSFTLHARGHDHRGDYVAVWFYTHAATAGTSDFVNQYAERRSARHGNNIVQTVRTVDDNYSEFVEVFTVRIGNQDNVSGATSCLLSIRDDDGPGIVQLEIISEPEHDLGYRIGDIIEIRATFTEAVQVRDDVGIGIRVGEGEGGQSNYRVAEYQEGSGTRYLTFSYQVQAGDSDADGISVVAGDDGSGFTGGGSLTASNGDTDVNRWYHGLGEDSDHNVDGSVYVDDVRFTSTPANRFGYEPDEEIRVALDFNQPVEVRGDAAISLRVGDEDTWRAARYIEGSGTDALTFAYTVKEGDYDYDGVQIQGGNSRHGYHGSGGIYAQGSSDPVRPSRDGVDGGLSQAVGFEVANLDNNANMVRNVFVASDQIWTLDLRSNSISAYYKATGEMDSSATIDLKPYQETPAGFWSDGSTVWVSETLGDRIYAYSLEDGRRLSSSDISLSPSRGGDTKLAATGERPNYGIWSDGTTMWLIRGDPFEVKAFDLATGEPRSELDLSPRPDTDKLEPFGSFRSGAVTDLWMDGETYWLAFIGGTMFAYNRSDSSYVPEKNIYNLVPMGYPAGSIHGVWVEEDTLWLATGSLPPNGGVVEHKLVKVRKPTQIVSGPTAVMATGIQFASNPANGFSYAPGEKVEISLTFNLPVEVRGDLEVSLRIGEGDSSETRRGARYVSGSGTTTLDFRYNVRQTDTDFDGISLDSGGIQDDGEPYGYSGEGRLYVPGGSTPFLPAYDGVEASASQGAGIGEIPREAGNDFPWGIYVGDTHYWIVDRDDEKLYAYLKSDYSYVADRDIDVSDEMDNPLDAWSNGETIWVSDLHDQKLYAYSLADGTRRSDSDINLVSRGSTTAGLWGDGETIWALRQESFLLEAHSIATGSHVPSLDKTLPPEISVLRPTGSSGYFGGAVLDFWVDGKTVWLPHTNGRMYAHQWEDGSYDGDRNIGQLPGKTEDKSFRSIWVEGGRMWAVAGGHEFDSHAVLDYPKPKVIKSFVGSISEARVSSIPADGIAYHLGEEILVDVTFSEAVDVLGEPTFPIWFERPNAPRMIDRPNMILDADRKKYATYLSGSGTDTLRFSYTMERGIVAEMGIELPPVGITGLGEDSIALKGTNSLVNQYYAGSGEPLADHPADSRPQATVQITSTPVNGASYQAGEVIAVSLTFDQKVENEGSPSLTLQIGDNVRRARFERDNNSEEQPPWDDRYTFESAFYYTYTVQEADEDTDGIEVGNLWPESGSQGAQYSDGEWGSNNDSGFLFPWEYRYLGLIPYYRNNSEPHADHTVIDGLEIVDFSSESVPDGAYGIGSSMVIVAAFGEVVTVTGTPQITLDIGGVARQARYTPWSSGEASNLLAFTYVVAEGDNDSDGWSIGEGFIDLAGGSIVDPEGIPVNLRHGELASVSEQRVDGTPPTLSSAEVSSDGRSVTVVLSEEVHIPEWLDIRAGSLGLELENVVAAVFDISVDGRAVVPAEVTVNAQSLEFGFDFPIGAGQSVKVAYDNLFAVDAEGMFVDVGQNPLSLFSQRSVRNNSGIEDLMEFSNGLTLSDTTLTIPGGDSHRLSVSLASEPEDNRNVSLSTKVPGLTISPTTLEFTASNWNTPQEVLLTTTSPDDNLDEWIIVELTVGTDNDAASLSTTWLRVLIDDNGAL